MASDKVKIKPAVHQKWRTISSGVAAFSVATVLLALQGSFGPLSSSVMVSMIAFVAAIPLCITSSLLSFSFSLREHVAGRSDKVLNRLMSFGIGLGCGGFFSLVIARNSLLAAVLAVSVVISFLALILAYRWMEPDKEEDSAC